ncbi:helix-turn-helix domain-containing protein [Lysinibacillus capsici]|uniref:helix-turn-helix domain-containing protein n=1 Tax=Lysinibacillus capsici TaxID=2115968 RepID=UPI003D737945
MLISDDFGKMLKSLRKKRGLTLADLSDLSGISISYLNRLEKGERKSPGFTKIIKLAEVLSVPVSSLVGSCIQESEDKPVSISELFFNHTIEYNDEVLDSKTKALLVEIAETVLLLKWEKSTILNDLQQIAELISELKEL